MDSKKNVLVIDDDREYTQLLEAWLAKSPFACHVSNSSMTSFNMIENCQPDIILLDLNMPNLNGHEVCAVLKAHKSFANVPILFLTATIGKDEEEKALALGAQGYLSKLIKKEALIETLTKYLA